MRHRSSRILARALASSVACSALVGAAGVSCSSASAPAGQACFGEWPQSSTTTADAAQPSAYVGDFSTGTDYLEVWNGTQYVRTFLKGVNLGRGVPGAFPGDFAIKHSDYQAWFDKMGQMGVNLVRIYSIHQPAFYDALAAHNCAYPAQTIYLMQGVELPNDPDMTSDATLDLHNFTPVFEQMIDDAIDCLHGNNSIAVRKNQAYGEFKTDVSHWTLGLLIGREVLAQEVLATDKLHPTETSFGGSALKLASGNPTSVWVTERLDHAILRERAKYAVNRPVGFANWLETDPLHHPTEGSKSMKDLATIDTSQVDASGAPTGVFASFHVYPYYPDFMSEDPGYQAYWSDSYGSDSYRGYLHDLKRYHGKQPVLVAEFGLPSSWGNAHYSSNNMHHGGHTEAMQAAYTQRMVGDIYGEKLAGAVYFAWMDEWFKTCWITDALAFPSDDYPKWHDLTDPQQNYGLLSFDLGPPNYDVFPETVGTGRVQSVKTFADAEYFYVKLGLSAPLLDGQSFVLGYDTYRDDLGESLLPDGIRTQHRSELALSVTAPATASLSVLKPYDMYAPGAPISYSVRHSVVSDIGNWAPVRRSTSVAHGSDNGVYEFPGVDQPIGELVARTAASPPTTRDGVVIDGTTIEIRIPWTMLQIADPSTFSAINDVNMSANTAEVSQGIALSVSIDGEVLETNRKVWPTWRGAPQFTERYKPVADALAASYGALPTAIP